MTHRERTARAAPGGEAPREAAPHAPEHVASAISLGSHQLVEPADGVELRMEICRYSALPTSLVMRLLDAFARSIRQITAPGT